MVYLVTKMYLRVELSCITEADQEGGKIAWVRRLGHALIESVEVEIGGSRIDKHYGTWLDIWYELARPVGDRERGYLKMIGDVPELTAFDGTAKPGYTLYVPLQFWFCRNTGLALPLIALQYHEVRLHFEFRSNRQLGVFEDCNAYNTLTMLDASLLVDYIYLDSEERRRFAQVGHEYLIEQLQFTGEESVQLRNEKFKLGFNHPTKELIWALRNGLYCSEQEFLAYTHEEDWTEALNEAAKTLVECTLVCAEMQPANTDDATTGSPDSYVFAGLTNGGTTKLWYYNNCAYTVDGVDLFSKIASATISVQEDASGCVDFTVTSVSHTLNVRDISYPISEATITGDCGIADKGICVCQWNNYGVLIDGTVNPVSEALIQLNGHDRFDKREGAYFNYVQPHQHHTNTPS